MERMKSVDPKLTQEKGEDLIEGAKSTVQDAVKNVKAEVQGRYEAAKDMIEDLREKDMNEILDNVTSFVKNRPGIAILGALFLGYGIGRLFGRKS